MQTTYQVRFWILAVCNAILLLVWVALAIQLGVVLQNPAGVWRVFDGFLHINAGTVIVLSWVVSLLQLERWIPVQEMAGESSVLSVSTPKSSVRESVAPDRTYHMKITVQERDNHKTHILGWGFWLSLAAFFAMIVFGRALLWGMEYLQDDYFRRRVGEECGRLVFTVSGCEIFCLFLPLFIWIVYDRMKEMRFKHRKRTEVDGLRVAMEGG